MKYAKLISLFLLGLFFLSSCSDDDEPILETSNSIVDIAAGDSQFSTLVAALQRTGLDAVLSGNGPFTVFAPTNEAFNALGIDLTTLSDKELSDILTYHVLGAKIKAGDITAGQTYVSTASASGPEGNALSMLVEGINGGVRLNGSTNVTSADIEGDNGIIHIVDKVLLPLDLVGHAAANSNFTSLVGALGTASGDLVNVLSTAGPYTVFAPINDGFDEISDVVATLSADQLASVLTYHVVGSANVLAGALVDGATITTVNGQDITVDLSSAAQLVDAGGNIANIIITDVQATNGVIHALDKVIIPGLQ